MAVNPTFIPVPFAEGGLKNEIQETRQSGQDAQDMTWYDGSPLVTLTPIDDGGKAPKGQDFNGVLNVLSSHSAFIQNGNRFKWSWNTVTKYGGYDKNSIVQSDDGIREYISKIDNNSTNPNSGSTNDWAIYSGNGSVPFADSNIPGIMTVINSLNSGNIGSALSANMGRILRDMLDSLTITVSQKLNISQAFGFGQSYSTMSYSSGVTYTNTTSRPIFVSVTFRDSNTDSATVAYVGGVIVANLVNIAGGNTAYQNLSFVVPSGSSYMVDSQNPITLWTELR